MNEEKLLACSSGLDALNANGMAQIKGGTSDKDGGEWKLVYINGKPYWIRTTRKGDILEIKSLY